MAAMVVKYVKARTGKENEFRIPYWKVDSRESGPHLLLTAALHGNEVQGSEVLRRFLPIAAGHLRRGSILMVPFANPPALWNRRPHIASGPMQPYGAAKRDNINCTWPGNPRGNQAERLSRILLDALVETATHNIDLHSWSRFTATAVLPRRSHPGSMELARAAAIRFIHARDWRPETRDGRPVAPCTLTGWFNETGRTAMCIEFSGQYGIVEREVRKGVRALTNCAKALGMFRGTLEGLDEPVVCLHEAKTNKVTAPHSGLFVEAGLSTDDWVEKGSLLGYLLSDRSLRQSEIRAPMSGYLYEYGCRRPNCDVDLADMHPYASRGDSLATIVRP